jgi:hypothetical protein
MNLRHTSLAMAATAAGLALVPTGASAGDLHAASYFKPKNIYDCIAYQAFTGTFSYVDTYKFGKHHTYAFGLKGNGSKFHGKPSKGHYKVNGSKIVPTSGALKKQGYYLLIQTSDLALVKNNGAFTGVGCRYRTGS